MLKVETVTPFMNPEVVSEIDTTYLEALVSGVCDYVENYTNQTITKASPKGLIQAVADMVVYYYNTMPHLKEMKNDDMSLVFTTTLPDTLTRRLTVYRRLRW